MLPLAGSLKANDLVSMTTILCRIWHLSSSAKLSQIQLRGFPGILSINIYFTPTAFSPEEYAKSEVQEIR